MQAILVMFRSDGERRSFSITRDMTVIGRREDCDLRIPLGEVSRKHCRLVRDGDTLRLEDLGSSNGTYLNGQRVQQEAMLNPGDSVQIGPVVFVLQVDGYPHDEDLHPVSANLAEMSRGAARRSTDASPPAPTSQSDVEDLIEGFDPVSEVSELQPPAHEAADAELGGLVDHDAQPADDHAHAGRLELAGMDEPTEDADHPPLAQHGDASELEEMGFADDAPIGLADHEQTEAAAPEHGAPDHAGGVDDGALEVAGGETLAPEHDDELGTLASGHNEGEAIGEDGALDVLSDNDDTEAPLTADELMNLDDADPHSHQHQPHG